MKWRLSTERTLLFNDAESLFCSARFGVIIAVIIILLFLLLLRLVQQPQSNPFKSQPLTLQEILFLKAINCRIKVISTEHEKHRIFWMKMFSYLLSYILLLYNIKLAKTISFFLRILGLIFGVKYVKIFCAFLRNFVFVIQFLKTSSDLSSVFEDHYSKYLTVAWN